MKPFPSYVPLKKILWKITVGKIPLGKLYYEKFLWLLYWLNTYYLLNFQEECSLGIYVYEYNPIHGPCLELIFMAFFLRWVSWPLLSSKLNSPQKIKRWTHFTTKILLSHKISYIHLIELSSRSLTCHKLLHKTDSVSLEMCVLVCTQNCIFCEFYNFVIQMQQHFITSRFWTFYLWHITYFYDFCNKKTNNRAFFLW